VEEQINKDMFNAVDYLMNLRNLVKYKIIISLISYEIYPWIFYIYLFLYVFILIFYINYYIYIYINWCMCNCDYNYNYYYYY